MTEQSRIADDLRPQYEKPTLVEQRLEELVQLGSGPVSDSCCCSLQLS